jgi:hypothetical protein
MEDVMESTAPFSQGRTDEVAVNIVRRLRLPRRGILRPGECVTLPADEAARMIAEGFAVPVKAEEAPAINKMQHRPMAKKGLE